jgi:hypothetical protein
VFSRETYIKPLISYSVVKIFLPTVLSYTVLYNENCRSV